MRTPDAPVGVLLENEGLYLLEYGDADCKTRPRTPPSPARCAASASSLA